MIRFKLDKRTNLVDESVSVQVRGLPKATMTIIEARFQDDYKQVRASHPLFAADADGMIDLTTDAPLAGTYAEPDPMALSCFSLPPRTVPGPQPLWPISPCPA